MDQKKRRNSILKKPPGTDEENTTEITTRIKRRISFSGKKSVKEFVAGEEQATIWGTSYEESAECMQVNAVESGVVGVNDKRIVLRNRRVVVEAKNANKRRSKKKVCVADNDKENVFIHTPQVEIESRSDPVSIGTSKKEESPVKSELMLVKSHVQTARTILDHLDSMNACSTTFDFINYSGAINKTVTIEQSVDVSLDENELQMFKFRVPVPGEDVSPNLSVIRDGSSPNIFSSSILMSDDDMKMLKLMKVQMGGLISTGEPLKMIESGEKIAINQSTCMDLIPVRNTSGVIPGDLPKQTPQGKAIASTVDEEIENEVEGVGRSLETKNLKRKTIRAAKSMDESSVCPESSAKSHTIIMDSDMMDVHSPMRKKPMHNQLDKPMDITAVVTHEQNGPLRRQTVHFDSAAMDESRNDDVLLCEETVCVRVNEHQTIHFDQHQIHEDTICEENDGPSPAVQVEHVAMDVSMVDETIAEMPQDASSTVTKKRQSIHGPVDILEESPKKGNESGPPKSVRPKRESIYTSVDIAESSPKLEKPFQSRRLSVHIPTDIVEDSPKSTREREVLKPKLDNRQTTYNTDIVQEDSMLCVSLAVSGSASAPESHVPSSVALRRTIMAAVDMGCDPQDEERCSRNRQSLYTPSDMIEEDLGYKEKAKHQKSIYAAVDMVEDSPKLARTNQSCTKPAGHGPFVRDQKSTCAPSEMMDETSKLKATDINRERSAAQSQDRKSIYTPSDMVEDSPKIQKIREYRQPLAAAGERKSIYTPSDMVEVSPKMQKTIKDIGPPGVLVPGGIIQNRKSICIPTEMVADSPKLVEVNESNRPPVVQSFKCVAQARKSIYTAADMVEDSPKPTQPSAVCKNADFRNLTRFERKSIDNPTDMIEDSPRVTKQMDPHRHPADRDAPSDRKSIYVPLDVVEDILNHTEAGKCTSLKRQSIYTCVDMVEDSPKASHTRRSLQRQLSAFDASPDEMLNQKTRQTVSSSTNMREDSPLEGIMSKPPRAQSNCQDVVNASRNIAKNTASLLASYSLETSVPRVVSRQTIYAPADIVDDTYQEPDDTQNGIRSSRGASSFKATIHQINCAQSPEATNRRTICAPSDILEDSPKSGVRRSIRTAVDIMEDSPKMPEPNKANPIAAAPKVIVRHMTLQPGLMGDNAAMRVLKSQQTKAKVIEPVQLNDSTMDVSVVDSAPLPPTRPNFSKLNEQLMRGEVKTFAEERKNKKSLFEQIEMIAADVREFESFHKKPNSLTAFPMQPKKTSFTDYTLELSRNTFDGQRRRGLEYTMDLSTRMHSKVEAIDHEKHSLEPDDNMNLSVPISPTSNGVPCAETEDSPYLVVPTGTSKRQTVHFHDENEMDVSVSAKPQDAAKSQPNRQTIHFHDHLELDKTSTQTCRPPVAATAFEKNPRTILFDKDNHMDESGHISNGKVEPNPQDISTMDVSMGDDDLNIDVEPAKVNQSCQENLTRQSCIVRASLLDAAPKDQRKSASNRHTIYAPAAMLEETMDQNPTRQDDIMDLSTSICPKPLGSKCAQRSQGEATSIGRQRRTIHCNDDLELDDTAAECPSLAHVSRMSQLKTSRVAHAPEIEISTVAQAGHEHQRASAIPTRFAGRKTIHLNQDLELDDRTEKVTENLKKPVSRQTIYFQQNDDMDESTVERPGEVRADNEFHCKEDVSKALPKPRRMTTFEDIPVDVDESPEKTTLRKSSFSRTLNFNEIAKATRKFQSTEQKDSPLFCYNPRLRRCESTTEIDRSLAEYLKAEAAATLYRRSPDTMAMADVEQSPQSVYYDAEEEQVERKQFLLAEQEDQMLEESGMQPLQKTATRGDIELIDEAAAKQDEPDHDHSEVSIELRGARANRLNHEFFDKELSMSPEPVQVELPRPLMEYAKSKRQTILEPEPMTEQSDVESMSPEAPAKPVTVKDISRPSRKTIHFTNEDAVDESFFDENLSKPAAAMKMQNNRRTVYFNESQNSIEEMDASLTQNMPESQSLSQTIGRSKAAQSMKEILRESDMLFTQSMLKPHLFEAQKATVYFDAKDMSLDTVSVADNPKPDENAECTPTKANKSRIPQLIGSAKKLQSMKNSMEFIQQKLPILSCSVQAKVEDAVSQDVDEVSEVPPDETSFTCKPKQLQESFETVEIPRKLAANEPEQLQESFETVEIPRRATTFQRNDTLYLCQNEVDITNISQKSNFRFEDVPITISDVSTYFAQKPPPSAKQLKEQTYSPNTTEALCNLDMNRFPDDTQLPKSSDSEDTAYNFDKFKKRYVELTCDSINSTGCNEDIEKTHLSLVNTLDEHESELVRDPCSELALVEMPPPQETTAFSTSVCRKCKRHKQAVSQNETTLSSFVLAPLTEYKMDLAALKELSSKPRVSDVAKVWRQNLRESDSFNFSGRSAIDLDDDDTMDNFIASLDKERRMAAQHRQRKEFKLQDSFVHTVRKQLQSKKSNWILNDLLLMQNILRFTHTRIRTFAIFISFTQKDPRGVDVEFNEMRIVQNTHHSRVWTAFDYALQYQLLVELPFDLSTLCPSSENLFQLLDHVEGVTQDVLKIGKDVLYLVLSSPASLIREPSGGIYIRKYARTRTAQNEVKRTEFQIEVRNMKRLSYESITQPPLYEFDEKVQLLPTGQDFLRVFLADPLRYMKS